MFDIYCDCGHSLRNGRGGVCKTELWFFRPFAGLPLALSPRGLFAPYAWLIRPLACSPSGSFTPWLIRAPSLEYTGDSLLRLVFQFTERQQTSVASRH